MSVGTVPEDALKYTDQSTADLHQRVSGELSQVGHPSTPESVNPVPELPQLGDLSRVVGGMYDESFGGVNAMTHSGTAKSKISMVIAAARELKRKFQRK